MMPCFLLSVQLSEGEREGLGAPDVKRVKVCAGSNAFPGLASDLTRLIDGD